MLENKLRTEEKIIERNSFIWNALASALYSAQSPLLLLIVTRILGLYEAGIFSISYTLAHMFTNVGLYNMRSFQVSDAKSDYEFSDYYSSRKVTTLAMIILCLLYSFICGYDFERIKLIIMWIGYRSIEAVEDVFHGEIQRLGRLDVVSKIVCMRIFISSVLFVIMLIISKNMIGATLVLLISSVIIFELSNKVIIKNYTLNVETNYTNVKKILYICFPVFISSFLYSYFVNAPKYAIDRYMEPEMQSIFAIIFLPNMVINMLGIFIFKPIIAKMGQIWSQHKIQEFGKYILKQMGVLCVGAVLFIVMGGVLGIPVLEIVYGVELQTYKKAFVWLLVFGGFSALNNYFSIIVTIMRKQKCLLYIYAVGMGICGLITNMMTKNYEMQGAVFSYGIVMGTIFILFSIVIFTEIKTEQRRYL